MLPARLLTERIEAGVDEVGRGCLAGPVCAAAVILPPDFSLPGLTDSKQLSLRQREAMDAEIRNRALAFAIGEASPVEIDRLNILGATFLAMHRAIEALDPAPEYLLIDGNRFRTALPIPYETLVKGDGRVASIAAASVLAKVHRDKLMVKYSGEYPGYGWERNVGYGTTDHLKGISRLGLTPLHRRSFRPCHPTLFDSEELKGGPSLTSEASELGR